MRQERSRRLARAVFWRPGKNRTSKSRLQSSSNLQRTGRAPSASSFLHRSDLPHEACVNRMHWTGKPRLACPVRFCSFRPMKVPLQKWDKVRQLGKSNYPATRGGVSRGETRSCFGVSIELDFRGKNNRDPVARQAGDPGYTFRNILAAPLSLTG